MDLSLYAPGLGYYVAGTAKFGPMGDYVTAPERGALFGRCLARQIAETLKYLGGGILEVGPGSGALAVVLLEELARLGTLPDQYVLLEVSPDLRFRQQTRLFERLGNKASCCKWVKAVPNNWTGIVIANEVIDAMPVARFRVQDGKPEFAYIVDDTSGFDWSWRSRKDDCKESALIDRHQLPDGYITERSHYAMTWIANVAERLKRGLLILIDYGYSGSEYYHRDRVDGTLMCHYRHHAHSDPFWYPGLQDITAHVDFSALAEAGRLSGLEIVGFSSQEAFLLSLGILEIAEKIDDSASSRFRVSQEIQQLATTFGMGERFKVLGLAKGIQQPPLGFHLRNRRDQL